MAYIGDSGRLPPLHLLCRELLAGATGPIRVLDLGAHRGQMLDEVVADEYVLVEPLPENLVYLEVRAENDPRVTLVKGVLGREAGETDMFSFSEGDQSGNLYSRREDRDYGECSIIRVPIVPYSSVCVPFTLTKCNIEGGEFDMIDDGFLQSTSDRLVIELHNTIVPGKNWLTAVHALEKDFEIISHGGKDRYMFVTAIRLPRP